MEQEIDSKYWDDPVEVDYSSGLGMLKDAISAMFDESSKYYDAYDNNYECSEEEHSAIIEAIENLKCLI